MDFDKQIKSIFEQKNINLTQLQIKQFEEYFNLLVEWNEKINLTTIIEQEQVIIKHFLDSCLGKKYINDNCTLLDIGAGAGFPSIPLKILFPNLQVVMIDSVNKKINFLNSVIDALHLTNCKAIHTRAEDLAKKSGFRESFDYVVSRAVASLNTLLEYSLPFVKVGGRFVAYKATNCEQEIENSQNALNVLGGKIIEVDKQNLFDSERSYVIVQKIKSTPNKYPRSQNKPRINPL